jgi:hypothetical protein
METGAGVTLPLTAEMLETCYEFLKTTPPFCDWNLHDGEDVKFRIGKRSAKFAEYQWDGKQHTVTMSGAAIGHTQTLIEALSHEMIHMHLEENGWESRGTAAVHNAAFRKFAAQVCKHHGFDPKAFF